MNILYLYDLKAKNKRDFNRVKRRFYYHLKKLALKKSDFLTKSVILVPRSRERTLDSFFKQFSKEVEVYKVHCESVEEL